jgi:hypothetical protein
MSQTIGSGHRRPRSELDHRAIDAATHLLAGSIWLEHRVVNGSMRLVSRIATPPPVARVVRTLRQNVVTLDQPQVDGDRSGT